MTKVKKAIMEKRNRERKRGQKAWLCCVLFFLLFFFFFIGCLCFLEISVAKKMMERNPKQRIHPGF